MSRGSFFVFSVLIGLLALLGAPRTSVAEERAVGPDSVVKVEPCCRSFPAGTVKRGFGAYAEIPSHAFFDPQTLEAMRAEVLSSTEIEAGQELREGPSELLIEDLKDLEITPKGPMLQGNFNGLDLLSAQHQGFIFYPPDTQVAASPTRVLVAANSALRLSTRSGGSAQITSLNDFFGELAPPLLFDPKIHYDNLSGRFYLVALSVDSDRRRSFLHLAVSRSSAPATLSAPEDWCSYRIDAKRSDAWADYPNLGMNEKWLAVSFNHFRFSRTFDRVNVFAFDLTRLANNASSCPSTKVSKFGITNDPTGTLAFTVVPAQHYERSTLAGVPLFLVSSQPLLAANGYTLWRLTGTGSKPSLSRVAVEGDFIYTLPPNSPQRSGPDLDTGDMRIMQAAYRDGKVWAVHATGCAFGPLPNESCVRAIELTPTASGATLSFETAYGGGEGWYYWMPGVAINGNGDVVVPFQRSHVTGELGAAVNGKRASATGFDSVRTLRAGSCGLADVDGSGRNRTGDYVGAQADPNDPRSVWIAGEHASRVGNVPCSWSTRVSRARY